MKREEAVELLADESPAGAKSRMLNGEIPEDPSDWYFVIGRNDVTSDLSKPDDDNWTVIALHKHSLGTIEGGRLFCDHACEIIRDRIFGSRCATQSTFYDCDVWHFVDE
jgi:hypothetical protein